MGDLVPIPLPATWASRAKAVASSRWTPVVVLVVVAVVVVWKLDAGRRAALERTALVEAAKLRAEGIATAEQKSARDLWDEADKASAESAGLRAEIAELKASSRGARPVVVIRAATGPVQAADAPRPQAPVPEKCPVCRCDLAPGDTGEVRLSSALFETRGRNIVFRGAAEAWRLSPGPPVLLFGGPLTAQTTVEAPRSPGYGFGMFASCGANGCGFGPAVAFAPWSLWGFDIEAAVGLTVAGKVEGGATAIVRRASR